MAEVSKNGLSMRWTDAVPDPLRQIQRVLVEVGPASPANVVHLIYSVAGGRERITRGWLVGTDPETGLQAFAADLPAQRPGCEIFWRPVLRQGARELDPGRVPPAQAPKSAKAEQEDKKEDETLQDIVRRQDTSRPKFDTGFDYLFRVFAPFVHDVHSVGDTPDGVRMYFQLRSGGLVRGPALNGEVLSGGGDWMRIRPDGIGIADVHALIRADDGSMILTEYTGMCDFGHGGIDKLAAGQLPQKVKVRLCPRYLTAAPQWSWLNRIQGFSVGEAHLENLLLEYDEYVAQGDGEAAHV